MVMKSETVATGAKLEECDMCGEVPQLQICKSAAGHYIGYQCCSPYSRESGYFKSWEDAVLAFGEDAYGR